MAFIKAVLNLNVSQKNTSILPVKNFKMVKTNTMIKQKDTPVLSSSIDGLPHSPDKYHLCTSGISLRLQCGKQQGF
jgi:hypothetical protein